MTSNSNFIVLGKPRFNDSTLEQIAIQEGVEVAWSQAFLLLGTKAPGQVAGDFSVAIRLPDGKTFMAIDRFAIRSLCYRQVGNCLLFAERADQLADSTFGLQSFSCFISSLTQTSFVR